MTNGIVQSLLTVALLHLKDKIYFKFATFSKHLLYENKLQSIRFLFLFLNHVWTKFNIAKLRICILIFYNQLRQLFILKMMIYKSCKKARVIQIEIDQIVTTITLLSCQIHFLHKPWEKGPFSATTIIWFYNSRQTLMINGTQKACR